MNSNVYEYSGGADDFPEATSSEETHVISIAGHPYILNLTNPEESGYGDPKDFPELYDEAGDYESENRLPP